MGVFNYICEGQMSIFDFMQDSKQIKSDKPEKLSVGDLVGRVVLGEVIKARITEVEGNDEYWFYRTDTGGCFKAGCRTDIEQMEVEAEQERRKYKTIEIDSFDKFFAVQYPPRDCDGHIMYGMVGITQGMLFYKEDCTYQFLKPCKNLEKEYKDMVFKLTHRFGDEIEYKELSEPIPTKRLYWSENGFYTDAEYVKWNG